MALCLGGLGLWTGRQAQAATVDQAEQHLRQQAALMADTLGDPLVRAYRGGGLDEAALADQAREYAATTGIRVTVADAELRVLASSDAPTLRAGVIRDPEVLAARRGSARPAIRPDTPRGDERLFVAVPVLYQGHVLGYVQCSVPTAPLRAEVARRWLALLMAGAGILGAAALASLALARWIAAPVQRLTAGAAALAAGRLEQRVTPAGPAEVQSLGRAFNRMAERVQETLARQQAFVADAAHELRSPLTGIGLRLELLQTQPRDDELAGRYLGQVEREVDHLRRLVDDLLTLSALDARGDRPRDAVDLAPLLYDLADEVAPLARAAGLDLRVDVPAHLPPLPADPEQLRRAVRNLLDNAITYTPAGGAVTLAARAGDGEVRLAVADTGVGIPPEALPYLFERFYRADRAHHRGGAGLGLALVRAIVQAHGGAVEVRSAPGAGSAFTVRLPVAAGEATPEPERRALTRA